MGVLGLGIAALAACGGSSGRPTLKVSAAASLRPALDRYRASFSPARVACSFAGSDQLAAQIRQGARPDVFASANRQLPDALFAASLVARPVAFATNRLVLAVPSRGGRVHALIDAERPGAKLAVGSPTVPVGSYTRQVLRRLGPGPMRAILANVRSSEPDVTGVVGKLTQGAVDAGFVYRTDVDAAAGRLRALELPASARPAVVYEAAVVRGARHPAEARAFVRGLLRGRGASALRRAGFGPPSR